MINVYFVPGAAGTELWDSFQPEKKYWVSLDVLIGAELPVMGLAADGSAQASPWGRSLSPRGPLPDYYNAAINLLSEQLGTGYTVVPWGWDFRKLLESAGALLAAAIGQSSSPENPAVIVAHSGGGLVARVAWSQLVASGQTAWVSRIVTLGTPHQGTYSAVQLFSGGASTVLGISLLSFFASLSLETLESIISGVAAVTIEEILVVIATWPSYYEILPFLGSPDIVNDPNRPLLYQANQWFGDRLSPTWLSHAATVWDVLMAQPTSMPPSYVLSTVAGTGISTPDILNAPGQLGTIYAYGSTTLGDGAVTVESALVPQSWQYLVPCAHADLPYYFASSGQLAAEVVAVRNPSTPIPLTTTDAGPFVQVLGPVPIPNLSFGQPNPPSMAGGVC